MINLLFISDSPRAELLRGHFQQQLKVRIAVVGDFDHGLKGVFEQRPLVVCIQDQIAGVTGESVARHIQLLLGSDAPSFILLHNANHKARPLSGLFAHLVDLTGPFEQVCSELAAALRVLLKDRWELICPVCPPAETFQSSTAAVQVAEASAADSPPTGQSQRGASAGNETVDDFNDLFEKSALSAPASHVHPADQPAIAKEQQPGHQPILSQQPTQPSAPRVSEPTQTAPLQRHAEEISKPLVKPDGSQQKMQGPGVSDQATDEAHEPFPVDELLREFEDSYRRRKRLMWKAVVAALLLVAGGIALWFRVQSGPTVSRPAPAPTSVQQQQIQGIFSSPRQTPVKQPSLELPSFIPSGEHDTGFSKANPGWKRYRGEGRDYRLFHEADRLRAVQVLAIGRRPIPTGELRRALLEVTGSEDYKVLRQEKKQGIVVESASGEGHSELLIYRNAPGGEISAFVIVRTP